MPYVPPDKRDTAWYLFYELFMVRVNPTKIRTVEEIKMYGTPTTGNEDYDREMSKSEDIVMISIAQMEDIYNQGYQVKIVNYDDTKKIYEYIAKHLVAMRNISVGSENFNSNAETLNELIRLDKFAGAIFEHARYGMKQDVPQSSLIARMRSDRFSNLGRNRQRLNGPEVKGKGSGSLRDYSTGVDAQNEINAATSAPSPVDEVSENPNLPKRISLERMFEEQRRHALNWGG
jgi:hypothetical protein